MSNGFIYIMSNPSFSDGRIKIGKSQSDPSSFRKKELYSTGVPEPFVVEYYAFVQDYNNAEKKIHKRLSKFRPNKDREFFSIEIPEAIIKIRELCIIKYEEVFYKSPHEIEQIEKEKRFQLEMELREKERIATLENKKIEEQKKEEEEKRKKENLIKIKELEKKQSEIDFWERVFRIIGISIIIVFISILFIVI